MLVKAILAALLFIVLIPGQFVRIPQKGSKMTVALVHGLVFFVLYLAIQMIVDNISEGFVDAAASAETATKPPSNTDKKTPSNTDKKPPTDIPSTSKYVGEVKTKNVDKWEWEKPKDGCGNYPVTLDDKRCTTVCNNGEPSGTPLKCSK
jgi:hypothetical protein